MTNQRRSSFVHKFTVVACIELTRTSDHISAVITIHIHVDYDKTRWLTSITASFSSSAGRTDADNCVDSFLALTVVVTRTWYTRHVVWKHVKYDCSCETIYAPLNSCEYNIWVLQQTAYQMTSWVILRNYKIW